ncbi:hypothetical protein TH61_14880 [Rufibacter sp. DG15C]|uniref:hypothetical protein n=1 Tax=Rufibacter sp. DG15C TaxID=1379909 RepID=UPI00078DC91C|nr:hypothetical protein [Rufibacter sp. DG15C]AMM52216.1 hypothetical protein TH61_14880 [Rufibacter sp. DG15C]
MQLSEDYITLSSKTTVIQKLIFPIGGFILWIGISTYVFLFTDKFTIVLPAIIFAAFILLLAFSINKKLHYIYYDEKMVRLKNYWSVKDVSFSEIMEVRWVSMNYYEITLDDDSTFMFLPSFSENLNYLLSSELPSIVAFRKRVGLHNWN